MATALLTTTRNGIVERLERGHCVVADAQGRVLWSVGNPEHVTFLRSSAKPMQAAAIYLSGAYDRFGLAAGNIAVACGSHNGEPRHVTTARGTLERAGVPENALGCGCHELSVPVALALAAAGTSPGPIHNNCSGKHAGMLAATAALGAPLESYLDPAHPLQQMIRDVMAECSGIDRDALQLGTDGCSAPNFAMPMHAIARCFAVIARPTAVSPALGEVLARVGAAMQADPWLVAGTGRFDTAVMQELPGAVIAKGGAEGLGCVALPARGLGVAVKFESGRHDGIGSVLLAILAALGVQGVEQSAALRPYFKPVIRNHRQIAVGETRHEIEGNLAELSALRLAAR